MWKDSYSVGVESIDLQHKMLFKTVDELLAAIDEGAGKEVFRQAIDFLKGYVIFHFYDEEEYQASIQYSGLEEHKKLHSDFTNTVNNFEKRLNESDYNLGILKELAGTLIAWLIYHVADADQKIVKDIKAEFLDCNKTISEYFVYSIVSILNKMTGISDLEIQTAQVRGIAQKSISISIPLNNANGCIYYSYTKQFSIQLFHMFTFMELTEVDEFMYSVLMELSNIISGHVVTALSVQGMDYSLNPPKLLQKVQIEEAVQGLDGLGIITSMGDFSIWTNGISIT